MQVLLSTATLKRLSTIKERPGGSYLFTGPGGIGKFTSARELISQIIPNSFQVTIITAQKLSIGIGQIQELIRQMTLKTAAGHRAIIVRNAELMTIEAQNAFLKLLEEPPLDTMIILTSSRPEQLLVTIISRCQQVNYHLPEQKLFIQWLERQFGLSTERATDLAYLARGLPGRAVALMTDKNLIAAEQALAKIARQLIDGDSYTNLKIAPQFSKLDSAKTLIESLVTNLRQSLRRTETPMGLLRQFNACERAALHLEANGNPKIAINQLALELAR